jgi:hypothetical protein
MNNILKKADFWLMIFIVVATGVFVLARGQDQNWDLLNYHFFTGYSVLHGRTLIDIAPSGLPSFLHPAYNVVSYLAFSQLPFPYGAWILLAIQLSSVPAIALIAKEISTAIGLPEISPTRQLAWLLCLVAPLWISELGTSFFSSSTAPLILWGLFLLVRSGSRQASAWFLSGAMFGLASGLKLTNVTFAIAASMSALYLAFRKGKPATLSLLLFAAGGCAGFLLTAGWYWHLWTTWGNPVFPLYSGIFKSAYFEAVNFRDLRWMFQSFPDFLLFIVQSAFGTAKTSEMFFADARLLIVLLLLPGALLSSPVKPFKQSAYAFLLFFFVGFGLWSVTFAYQRYLIPLEILLGLVILVLVARITESDWKRFGALSLIAALSVFAAKIPDWGHGKVENQDRGPFDIRVPEKIASTPARYLIIGYPVAYILPSLHPDSRFYGLGLSNQMDALIGQRFQENSSLPIRLLINPVLGQGTRELLARLRITEPQSRWNCTDFLSRAGRYVICELEAMQQTQSRPEILLDAQYAGMKASHSTGILWEKGLSFYEPWGRWSEGNELAWGLGACLPKGHIKINIDGHAFGPNAGQPFKLMVGSQSISFVVGNQDDRASLRVNNQEDCVDTLKIQISGAVSPAELGIGPDPRKLGLAVKGLQILSE